MSIMKQRLPLGEFSSSKINKLAIANIADVNEPRSHGENNVGAICLPSIKSLMVSPEVYENTKSLPIPLVRSGGGGIACASKASRQDNVLTKTMPRDYSELSKKLQIRLQFAYYKYKTKQTNKNFTDLKSKHSITRPSKVATHTKSEPLTKRRKLVLSQGHYKTPAKSRIKTPYSICSHGDASSFTCFRGGSESLSITADMNIADTTTPIRNNINTKHSNSHNRTLYQRQETPTSIKAAKSLIHLFTSNQ